MATKVLVADDSLTIQKVIGITLASSGYELVQCTEVDDLFEKLRNDQFNLVLLDFNLSEKKTGYDLAREIKEISPQVGILAMLGTFDTVDEGQLTDCGIGDKIVKPFESGKFIKKCQELLENSESAGPEESVVAIDSAIEEGPIEEAPIEEEATEFLAEENEENEIGDDWVVNSPDLEDKEEIGFSIDEEISAEEAASEESNNPLLNELEGWGMEVPGVIGSGNDSRALMPPMMEEEGESLNESVEFAESVEAVEDEAALPASEDLDYPDMSAESEPTSKMISLDELASEEDEEEEFNIEVASEEVNHDLAAEIEKDTDDFWAVDQEVEEAEEVTTEEPIIDLGDEAPASDIIFDAEESISDEEPEFIIDNRPMPQYEAPKELSTSEKTSSETTVQGNVDIDEVVRRVQEQLAPALEQMVREFCATQVERIAWEVIPDLAENLIRTEIKEISEVVQRQ